MRTWAMVLVTALTSTSLHAADWKDIKPHVTTEAELIASFGPPNEVVSTFAWSEWSAKWKKRPKASHYILRYTVQDSKSALLVGPGGPADDVRFMLMKGEWELSSGTMADRLHGPQRRPYALIQL